MDERLQQVFVGGTGRSGTTILTAALGTHPDIWATPFESRFLVDPGGLLHLVDALSTRFSPATAHDAIVRFEELMLCDLSSPFEPPYSDIDLAAMIGRRHYADTVRRFVSSLYSDVYDVSVDFWTEPPIVTRARNAARLTSALASRHGLLHPRATLAAHRGYPVHRTTSRYLARRFDRADLAASAATLVDELFARPMRRTDKTVWCEKTPHNFLFLDELAELFPDALFVHVKRDPRGVVFSLQRQRWGPSSLEQASRWVHNVCRAWLAKESRPPRFVEVKVEDLASDPVGVLAGIVGPHGLEPRWDGLPEITPAHVDYWREEMPVSTRHAIERVLGDTLAEFGYGS